jgi:predicted alpha/beta hydrolase
MPTSRYFLVQKDDGWTIRFGDDDFGPYASRQEALLFAVDAAQKLGEIGEASEVCLLGENGHFHPEWTYGRDTYPPRL